MGQDKEQLKKLLKFVDQLAKQEGNEWFKEEMSKRYGRAEKSAAVNSNPEFEKLFDDIKRTKHYLQSIDRSSWLEGIQYYSKVKYPELRIELVSDYKEMKIADKQNDIVEYTRRVVMQLENCLNCICQILSAYDVIKASPAKFKNDRSDLLVGEYSFFDNRTGNAKPLGKISIQSKIFFVKQIYDISYSYTDMNEMITLRNNSSHRGKLLEKDAEIIKKAKTNIMERKSSYFKCYDTFFKKLKDLT